MVQSQWTTAALVATGALGAAAGVALSRCLAAPGQQPGSDALVQDLERELERQKRLRAQERSGRTNAERVGLIRDMSMISCRAVLIECSYMEQEAREALQRQQQADGYTFEAVATVASCFADRRGTPRQGVLVPAARATIRFHSSVSPAALEGLEQFSHLWVLFVFHENTNAAGAGKKTTFPAKIAPPRQVRAM